MPQLYGRRRVVNMTTAAWVGQNHAASAGMRAVAASGRRYRSILMLVQRRTRLWPARLRGGDGARRRRRDVLYAQVALRRRADHADTPARPRHSVLELRRHERKSGPDLQWRLGVVRAGRIPGLCCRNIFAGVLVEAVRHGLRPASAVIRHRRDLYHSPSASRSSNRVTLPRSRHFDLTRAMPPNSSASLFKHR